MLSVPNAKTQRTNARAYKLLAVQLGQISNTAVPGMTRAAMLRPVHGFKLLSVAELYSSGAMVSECGVASACQDLSDQVDILLVRLHPRVSP